MDEADKIFDIYLNNSQRFHLQAEENEYFATQLPTPLYCKPNECKVALVSFSYDRTKLINLDFVEFKVFYANPKLNQRYSFENLHLNSIIELLNLLKNTYDLQFDFVNDGGLLKANFAKGIQKVEFVTENLQRVLGFPVNIVKTGDLGSLVPNIYAMLDAVYVSCDFCDYRAVSSLYLPVLAELPNSYKNDNLTFICETFQHLSFVTVSSIELFKLRLSLINQKGSLVKLISGASLSCILRFTIKEWE